MFTGNIMMIPGQEQREFTVLRPDGHETENGRELTNSYTKVGAICAILAQAKPEELERWRQINHSVTHKIIMQHRPPFDIRPGDIFAGAGRRFYNQTLPYDPGGLGHWTVFYCNERNDVT